MDDDELRQRLRAMPEPTATIDVDAVVADARRRRRPKVVGVGVAVGAACLAFLAPVVVPGLLGPDPVTATLQEQGVAEQDDSGAEPEAPAPAPAASDGADPDASTLQTSEGPNVAGPGPLACTATPVGEVAPGLAVSFAAAPVDGVATLLMANDGDATITVRLGGVGEAIVVDGAIVAADVGGEPAYSGPLLRIEPDETERVEVAVAAARACDGGNVAVGEVVPVVAVAIGGAAEVQTIVVGDPSAS